jgi:CheY-like chemotaxis protein
MTKPTILCVDDTLLNLSIYEELLLDDYSIETVTSGRACLDYLERNTPALIIMDYVMPDLDGIEVCRLIRQNHMFDDMPILFCTASPYDTVKDNARQAGANGFLAKPFEESDLKKVISCLIKKPQARSYLARPSLAAAVI